MDNMDIDWLEGKYPSSVDEIIERRAGEFLAEIHAMAEDAMPKKPPTVRQFYDQFWETTREQGYLRQLAAMQANAFKKEYSQEEIASMQNAYPNGVYTPNWLNTIGNALGLKPCW